MEFIGVKKGSIQFVGIVSYNKEGVGTLTKPHPDVKKDMEEYLNSNIK